MLDKQSKKKYKSKAGPIVSTIGASILLTGSFLFLANLSLLNMLLDRMGETWASISVDPSLLYVRVGTTMLFGIGAFSGAIFAFKNRLIGGMICVIMGIISLIGPFIPIGFIDLTSIEGGIQQITLSGWGFAVDPFLIIIGGIISIFTKGSTSEEMKKDLIEKSAILREQMENRQYTEENLK